MDSSKQYVKLNVGGKIFETTVKTLSKSPYFVKLLKKYNGSLGSQLFIDRSPHIFKHVLSYMRNESYSYPKIYLDELEYFGLAELKVDIVPRRLKMTQILGRYVYVEGKTTKSFLLNAFEKFGPINSCIVESGYGLVEFEDYRDVDDALKGLEDGPYFDQVRSPISKITKPLLFIFTKTEFTKAEIDDMCGRYGGIESISKVGKSFFVSYKCASDAVDGAWNQLKDFSLKENGFEARLLY